MKKVLVGCIIIFAVLVIGMAFLPQPIFATADNSTNVLSANQNGELTSMKDKASQELQDYTDRYGSETYGFTAYILNKVRIYSIPFCFVGIAIGAIYQYVIGIRKLDVRDKGFSLLIAFVTILIICQVLPLIFAIVVKGWRG
ncbi:MAG: hypothetical protein IJ223_05505 [Clostridia bacterium]|nr:hypothetical protein [Clostridia bacterium]